MKHLVHNHWKNNISSKMMLLLNHHKVQKTPPVLTMLKDECNSLCSPRLYQSCPTIGCSFFNGPCKRAIDNFVAAHLEENINDYLQGNFTASEWRILLIKWIGKTWEEVAANKNMTRGFKKCGVSVESEDNEIRIKDLQDY